MLIPLSFIINNSECFIHSDVIMENPARIESLQSINNLGISNEIDENDNISEEMESAENRTILDDFFGKKSKRSRPRRLNSPCSCDYKDEVLDLGINSFPRYHSQKVCVQNSHSHCTHGSTCKELEHKILVLQLLSKNEVVVGVSEKFYNEFGLRYIWSYVNIKIDCRCLH